MFIRFVRSEVDEDSHVAAGLFCAAFKLLDEMVLSDHEYDAVVDLVGWFSVNLRGPFEYRLRSSGTISDELAERDVLALQRTAYADLAQMGAITQGRITRSEVKYVSTINVAEIRKRADELAKNYRDLDARIQELNWQTELVE